VLLCDVVSRAVKVRWLSGVMCGFGEGIAKACKAKWKLYEEKKVSAFVKKSPVWSR
jgi:hypothetical protein